MTRIENIGPHKLFLGDSSEVLKEIEGVHSVVTDPPYHLTSIVKRFGKEGSAPAKHGTDGAFARASKGFMGKCYHPDTEMLTSTGWHKVGDIAVGSTIATLNPDTRELVWQDVSQVHCYPFAGDMVHVKHRSAEQVITPNHKMVVSHDGGKSLSLIQPHELKRTFHLFAQAKPQKGRTDRVTIQSERLYGSADNETREECEEFDPVAFFRFLGLWLGDGFVVCRKNDHPANDFFGVSVKKPRKVEAVRNAIESLGIRFTETQTENGMVTFYCYNFALLGWLKPLGKAKDKHIPSWLFEWDSTILEYLYQGLIDTDGCKQGKDQEVFFTSSVSLANDFQILCLLTGRSCSITMRPGGKEVVIAGNPTISSDAWVCCVLKPGKRMYGEKSESSSNVVYSYPYEGDVVCVGVNEHHIVYTRFNGKPVWSGNSWDGGDIAFRPEFWELVGNAMLPGAHLLAFSGSRTYHRMAVGIDDAGFEIRDQIMWLYGSGMPKSLNISKAIDKSKGAEREVVGVIDTRGSYDGVLRTSNAINKNWRTAEDREDFIDLSKKEVTVPSTDEAKQWEGWGTSLKPSFEPLVVARKNSVEDENISSVLLELEAKAWLLSLVFNVDKASTLNHPDLNVALNIARWDVAKFTSIQEDLSEVTDTSQLKLKANTFWNTVSSWKTTWEEVLKRGNTFITEMKSNQTIDLKILKSCLSMIMPESIIKDATIQDGQIVFVKNVEKYSNAAMLKLNGILELSALENAISREVIDSQAVDEKVKHEPICVARKPLIGTNVENVLEHGTGALNIDGCRIRNGSETGKIKPDYLPNHKNRVFGKGMGDGNWENVSGRWPANVIHDGSDEVLAAFPVTSSGQPGKRRKDHKPGSQCGTLGTLDRIETGYGDTGSAARFYYCAKASRSDRNYGMEDPGPQLKHGDTLRKVENAELKGNIHPTVKPNDLMRYLCRLVTPPNGIVLDPFMGSGSTGIAAIQEGFRFIGIERDPEYFDIAVKRIREAYEESKKYNLLGDLF